MAPPINVQDWYGDCHTCQIASGALAQTPYLDLRGPTSKGGEGRGRGEGRKGNGREGREGRGNEPPPLKSWIRPCSTPLGASILTPPILKFCLRYWVGFLLVFNSNYI